MHRSRPLVLAILAAAAAACSTHDGSDGTALLSQDSTLVARLDRGSDAPRAPLPTACGTVDVAARPAAASQRQSEELTRQAQDAEIHGDLAQAQSLLRRAATLDATNKSAAYHLGRTSESLGDRSAAIAAYCRYLALTPTSAESAEARARVSELSKTPPSAPARTAARSGAVHERAHRASADVVAGPSAVEQTARAPRAERAERAEPAEPAPATTNAPPVVANTSVASGDVAVDTASKETAAPEPASAPRVEQRGPTRTQGAIVGAAAGAIIGAASGRSVKSAVIGAAAGGVLGGVVIGRYEPRSRRAMRRTR